jgi:hypothetical protein
MLCPLQIESEKYSIININNSNKNNILLFILFEKDYLELIILRCFYRKDVVYY